METGQPTADVMQSPEDGPQATTIVAGLAIDDQGSSDRRPPLVLLHGLTFDRRMWGPALAELRALDPGRRVLAIDLPGHGESPAWPSYDVESVAEGVHRVVEDRQLESPVVVGHSISAVIATVYGARYPTRGIVNVDQSLQFAPFAGFVRSLADQLRGPAFPDIWKMFAASMHIELLPDTAQELVRSTCHARQDLVLGYWRDLLERPLDELSEFADEGLTAVRRSSVRYLVVAGTELGHDYQVWLNERLPGAAVIVWPGSGHFPHLAYPERFAECLAATAQWAVPGTGVVNMPSVPSSRVPDT
jgi:pimeloyl-ACP methyl ester carboxylesterase